MAANDQMIVAAIVVAAGSGSRLGADVPKAFVEVAGRTLLEHACERLLAHPAVSRSIVVAPADWIERAAKLTGVDAVAGGATRQQSVDFGLRALGSDADVILVHDVARAFAPVEVTDRVLAALADGADAAIPGLPVTDTIKRIDEVGTVLATLDRGELVAVQTPQGFRRAALVAAHATAVGGEATDDAALIEAAHGHVQVVAGDERAFKITVPLDLALAEVLLRG
jgi:2-C-methyl-D-erythritol 4-phosphate cytidylyltransferase